MKKSVFIFFMMLVCFTTSTIVFGNSNEIKVTFVGEPLKFDVAPKIIDNRTFVSMRVIFEKMGYVVKWDSKEQKVNANKDNISIAMKIGSNTAYINGKPVNLDAYPRIIDGRTLVPLRFISENSSYDVLWDENTKTVFIEQKSGDYDICEQTSSCITTSGDSVFLSDFNKGTFKFNTDCSKVTKILDTYSNPIQVIDNCLYGRIGDNAKYYKLDLNTNKLQNIIDSEVCNDFVFDGWIYYSDMYVRPWNFKRIKLDGTEQTKLFEDAVRDYCIVGDYIYYTDIMNTLVKRSLIDSGDSEVICDEFVTSFCLYRNEVYFSYSEYIDESHPMDYKGIFKYSQVDKSVKLICDTATEQLNVINNCIYYVTPNTSENNTSVYRMKIDGSYNIKLLEESITRISVVGNYIYYFPAPKDNEEFSDEIFRMHTDGSNKERLTDIFK